MKSDYVFILEGDQLRSLSHRPFKEGLFGKSLEDALQTLIEEHPQLLPGQEMDPAGDDPPRFVLLYREMPVADWSVDLLLSDHRGVLTLVETKLIQNPEARREVIGQILEYATNAIGAWGQGRVREKAAEFWTKKGQDLDEVLQKAFGVSDLDMEAFWDTIEDNLRNGKIRLIVAADQLSPEVRRIIEYLNANMAKIDVFGLELRCYGEEPGLVLVPHLVGQTQTIADEKGGPKPVQWKAEQLRKHYESLSDRELAQDLCRVLDWAIKHGFFLETTAKNPSFGLRGRSGTRILTFHHDGTVYCYLTERVYQGGTEERDHLVECLNEFPIFDYQPEGVAEGRNSRGRLSELTSEQLETLLQILEEFCGSGK